MTAEGKLRTLAAANPTLKSLLGTGAVGDPFRFYDTQHVQGSALPAVTFRRVSTVVPYQIVGRRSITWIRFQIDVRDSDPEHGRTVMSAVIALLDAIDLNFVGGQTVPPGKAPACFVLNQRDGMDFQLNPPVWVQTLDVRVLNLEE